MSTKLAPQTSRRHHHVLQHYLRAWSTGGKVWCLRDGEPFNTNTVNVAVETDFYKIHKLNEMDLQIIRHFVDNTAHEAGREAHKNLVSWLLFPIYYMEQHREKFPDPA